MHFRAINAQKKRHVLMGHTELKIRLFKLFQKLFGLQFDDFHRTHSSSDDVLSFMDMAIAAQADPLKDIVVVRVFGVDEPEIERFWAWWTAPDE